ncbi:19516_t:CDS:1 [Gigaspora margarita]|uniref:19516_t:CDS:1 n=1 Tax=Gigaspora margarita TaxID=4874 RepID=A0ABN7UTE6_GIGMA|nr:19516_t:CDS:1 [Gigaspora margarita]
MVLLLNPEYKLAEMNKKILKLTKITDIRFSSLIVKDLTVDKKATLEKLKEVKTLLWTAWNTENQAAQNERISFYMNHRYKDMRENITWMINSILARHSDRVSFKKIIMEDKVITESKAIKEATRSHYKNWTKFNIGDNSLWPEW